MAKNNILTGLTGDDTLTVPGGQGKSVWCLVRVYGTWNSATLNLTQDSVVVTDWSAVAADQAKVTCLKCGTVTADFTGTPTSITVEVLPIMN